MTSFKGFLPTESTSPAATRVFGTSIASEEDLILRRSSIISRLSEIGEGVRIRGVRSPATRPNFVPEGERRTNSSASSTAFSNVVLPPDPPRRIDAEVSITITTSLSVPARPKKLISFKKGLAKAITAAMIRRVRRARRMISSRMSLLRLTLSDSHRNIHAPQRIRSAVRLRKRWITTGIAAARRPVKTNGAKNDISLFLRSDDTL